MKKAKIIGVVILLLMAIWGIIMGLQNRYDPLWAEFDSLLLKDDIVLIQDRAEELGRVFRSLQRDESLKKISPIELISRPFLPIWEYEKFMKYLKLAIENRFIVFSGVTGSGKTTIISRIARLISGSPKRELLVACVPRLEVEYHKLYIGQQTTDGFKPGRLIKFFEKSFNDPLHNYVLIIDDIDKMNPESFFGSAIWGELDNPHYDHPIENYTDDIKIPPNFYMISVTHSGISLTVELNDEHFRRLGHLFFIAPNYVEFYQYLKTRVEKSKIESGQIKKLIYFFVKANEFIKEKYSYGHTLGHWSTLKKYYRPDDFDKFVTCFVEHVNAFKPDRTLRKSDFNGIFYSLENNGLLKGTNFFSGLMDLLIIYGLFSEVSVGLLFVGLSALFGWMIFLRRRRYMKSITEKVYRFIEKYNHSEITYERVVREIMDAKMEIDNLIHKRKINYTEAVFFYYLIEDRLKSIDNTQMTRELSREFSNMLNHFLSDGILDDMEYEALSRFLNKFKFQISEDDYLSLKKRIDDLYLKSREKDRKPKKK